MMRLRSFFVLNNRVHRKTVLALTLQMAHVPEKRAPRAYTGMVKRLRKTRLTHIHARYTIKYLVYSVP